jgi:glycosyltransferase involved in cell wall biosynthesis
MAESVSSLNCNITIVGRKLGDCCKVETVPYRTKRFKMLFKRGFFFYKFFNIRLFIYLLINKADLLVSNDLDTLFPNFLVSKLKQLPLVYDSHEYFTGLPEVQNRPFVKGVWMSIEKMILPHLKHVITVSEPIAELYEKIYNVRPLVIRNVSRNASHITKFTRDEIGVQPNDLLLIIQGTGINIDKGAEELIEAVNLSDNVALLVVGSGDVVPKLINRVRKLNIGNKVKFIPTVPWQELMKFSKAADVGLCLEKDTNINYHYSLPNKLFDYIAAGIPVIASTLPETGKIIRDNGCGIIISSVTPEKISYAISELKNNHVKLAELKRNALLASTKLRWEIESRKVIDLYTGILKNNVSG